MIENISIDTTSATTAMLGENAGRAFSIPGWKLPHPAFPADESCFKRLPMNGNLGRLAFALNRMCPADVQVTGIAPVPVIQPSS